MITVHKKFFSKIILAFVAIALPVLLFVAPVQAADYNCGAYGAGTYQEAVCASDGLADTGQSIWPILIAVLLILLGTFMLYRTRKKMKTRASHSFR